MNWETKAKRLKLNAGWWMQRSLFTCRSPFSNITKCTRASPIRGLWKMETEVIMFYDVFLNSWPPIMWLAPPSPALGPCTSWDCQWESYNPIRKYYSRGKAEDWVWTLHSIRNELAFLSTLSHSHNLYNSSPRLHPCFCWHLLSP